MRWIIIVLFAITLLFALFSCSPMNGLKLHSNFVKTEILNNPEISVHHLESEAKDFQLHYRTIGKAKKAIVIWVHGTPGNWTDSAYLYRNKEFISETKLVMLDRPGWGESQYYKERRLVTSFAEISTLVKPLLTKLKADHPDVPLILLGHSWGGSVVPTIAFDHPDQVDGVIALAAGLDPDLTKPRWYNRFASTYIGNAMIGDGLRLANDEIYALRPELLKQHDRWTEIKQPMIVIQGKIDKLVNPKNADYAETVLPKENSHVLRLSKQGHLLQFERMDLIARCITAMASKELLNCS